jgi:hypothetical protein
VGAEVRASAAERRRAARRAAREPTRIFPRLRWSDQYDLNTLTANDLHTLDWHALAALRSLVAKALGVGHGVGRTDLTLNERVWLRGLSQAARAEESRRYGNEYRQPAGQALRPKPRTPEQTLRGLRVLARCADKELEALDSALGERPPRRDPRPSALRSRAPARTERRRARPRERRARRARSPARRAEGDEPDLELAEAVAA